MLGDIHTVLADHGGHFAVGHRILRPELAGAPLDLGTYPLSLATWLLGARPGSRPSAGRPHPAGVDGLPPAPTLQDPRNRPLHRLGPAADPVPDAVRLFRATRGGKPGKYVSRPAPHFSARSSPPY
ncbi:hypothetical protein [Streptomyces puniciscabiei]|uniref:hypothetical protein n=1 Tax=Streptomyces puniciscabiei TaxID=164348 RepID=UPI0006EBADB3|nr:hypothetical protein [Streptomyces puniciscabiei]